MWPNIKYNNLLPKDDELNERFLTRNADRVYWPYVSGKIKLQNFSDEFFDRFQEELIWQPVHSELSARYHECIVKNPTITTEFAHRHKDKIKALAWFKNGKLHREDGPALIFPNGTEKWKKNGKLHREDGPAIVYGDGQESWYFEDEKHRLDGPAIIRNDFDMWYVKGLFVKKVLK